MRRQRRAEVHVGDGVAAEEHKVVAHEALLVHEAQRVARGAAAVRVDGVDGHGAPLGRPLAGAVEVGGDGVGVCAAEDVHLGHAVGGEPLEGVLDHGRVDERQERLGRLCCDGAEALQQGCGAGECDSRVLPLDPLEDTDRPWHC